MVTSREPRRYSYAEYLELERQTGLKHEFWDGRVHAMSGGTPPHSRIGANLIAVLSRVLEGRPCVVYTSDLKIRVVATGLATYPDVSVVCGALEHDPADRNAVTNPIVLIEVLSDSTEGYDRNEKFAHYRQIPSLQAYVLVEQDARHIEVLTRNDDGTWTLRDVRDGSARLDALDCSLALDDIYRDPLAPAG